MTMEQVRKQLKKILEESTKEGKDYVIIVAKELYDSMDNKPSNNHRYPMCCTAMREIFNEKTDEILYHTPSFQSSTLKIKYSLPRK